MVLREEPPDRRQEKQSDDRGNELDPREFSETLQASVRCRNLTPQFAILIATRCDAGLLQPLDFVQIIFGMARRGEWDELRKKAVVALQNRKGEAISVLTLAEENGYIDEFEIKEGPLKGGLFSARCMGYFVEDDLTTSEYSLEPTKKAARAQAAFDFLNAFVGGTLVPMDEEEDEENDDDEEVLPESTPIVHVPFRCCWNIPKLKDCRPLNIR